MLKIEGSGLQPEFMAMSVPGRGLSPDPAHTHTAANPKAGIGFNVDDDDDDGSSMVGRVCIAFDLMIVSLAQLSWVPRLLPGFALLFPSEDAEPAPQQIPL